MNIPNRCDVQPEDPSVTTSKVILEFELQFSRVKCNVNNVFGWNILRDGDIFNNILPDHTKVYSSGPYQR